VTDKAEGDEEGKEVREETSCVLETTADKLSCQEPSLSRKATFTLRSNCSRCAKVAFTLTSFLSTDLTLWF
jgi:hypothetical protein